MSDAGGRPPRVGVGETIVWVLLGVAAFYAAAFATVMSFAQSGGSALLVVPVLLVVGAVVAWRDAGVATRARLARLAVGVGVGMVMFGGCIALLASGRVRIAG